MRNKEYTEEQYRKDKKKLIGVGYLIMAFLLVGLHFWNMGLIAERRVEREKIEKEKIDQPVMFDFEKKQAEIFDKALEIFREKKIEVEITYKRKNFDNFSIEISSQWIEAEIKELPEAILYDFPIIDEVLFLAHNFCIKEMMLKQFGKREDLFSLPKNPEISDIDITLFAILKLKEEADIKQKIEQLAEKRDDFKIKEIELEKINEDKIKIKGYYHWLIGDPQLPKIEFYSYKQIKKINENSYAFLFLSNTLLENNKNVDKIFNSVIIK